MAEGEQARFRIGCARRLMLQLLEFLAQGIEPAQQQIVLVVEVCVERGAADIGAIDDFLYG
jgi:hypothetical protein